MSAMNRSTKFNEYTCCAFIASIYLQYWNTLAAVKSEDCYNNSRDTITIIPIWLVCSYATDILTCSCSYWLPIRPFVTLISRLAKKPVNKSIPKIIFDKLFQARCKA